MGGYTSDKQKPHSFSCECGLFVAEAPNASDEHFSRVQVLVSQTGLLKLLLVKNNYVLTIIVNSIFPSPFSAQKCCIIFISRSFLKIYSI